VHRNGPSRDSVQPRCSSIGPFVPCLHNPATTHGAQPEMRPDVRPLNRPHRLRSRSITVTDPGSSWLCSPRSSRCGSSRRVAAAGARGPQLRETRSPTRHRPKVPQMTSTDHRAGSHSLGSPLAGWSIPRAGMSGGTGQAPNGPSTSTTAASRAPTRLRAAPDVRPLRKSTTSEMAGLRPRNEMIDERCRLSDNSCRICVVLSLGVSYQRVSQLTHDCGPGFKAAKRSDGTNFGPTRKDGRTHLRRQEGRCAEGRVLREAAARYEGSADSARRR
jgi:hypothetical protein